MNEILPDKGPDVEHELKGATLDRLQEHSAKLYGRRNNIYLDSRVKRIDFLNVALGDLQDAVRKGSERSHLEATFARLPSRIFCIAHSINNVSVSQAMVEKYPQDGCAYCSGLPCQCGDRRPEPVLSVFHSTDPPQAEWSLSDWQRHLDRVYGEVNRKRGIENIFNRLFKEVSELMSLEHNINRSTQPMNEIEHEYGLELADSLAWTTAAANFCNIDLEKAFLDRYAKGCGKCGGNPCDCINFSFEQLRA